MLHLVALLVVLLTLGCATTTTRVVANQSKPPSVTIEDMSGVIHLWGRWGFAQGCAIDEQMALTNAHVVKPVSVVYAHEGPDWPMRWSDAAGNRGITVPAWMDPTRDLAYMLSQPSKPFKFFFPIAEKPPTVGTKIYILGYDRGNRKAGLAKKLYEGEVRNVYADHLVTDDDSERGSSGSCVVQRNPETNRLELVGINAWAIPVEYGEVGIVVGLWGDLLEDPREKEARKK